MSRLVVHAIDVSASMCGRPLIETITHLRETADPESMVIGFGVGVSKAFRTKDITDLMNDPSLKRIAGASGDLWKPFDWMNQRSLREVDELIVYIDDDFDIPKVLHSQTPFYQAKMRIWFTRPDLKSMTMRLTRLREQAPDWLDIQPMKTG